VNTHDSDLDRYAAMLRSLTTAGNAVPIHAVACKVQGGATEKAKRAARAALDELVAQGLAEMPFPGRYRALVVPAGVRVNGREVVWSDISVKVPEETQPRLDEPGIAGVALGRALSLHDDEIHGPLSAEARAEMLAASPEAERCAICDDLAGDCSCEEDEEPDPTVARLEVECRVAADEPAPVVSAVNRAAGSVVDALLGASEYPDAIIAEAQVFAKRAAKALEVARAERERAEAEERGAFEAWNRARDSREAARERVKLLERIAQGVE